MNVLNHSNVKRALNLAFSVNIGDLSDDNELEYEPADSGTDSDDEMYQANNNSSGDDSDTDDTVIAVAVKRDESSGGGCDDSSNDEPNLGFTMMAAPESQSVWKYKYRCILCQAIFVVFQFL